MIPFVILIALVSAALSIPDRRARYVALGVMSQSALAIIWTSLELEPGFLFLNLFWLMGIWPLTRISKRAKLGNSPKATGLLLGTLIVMLSLFLLFVTVPMFSATPKSYFLIILNLIFSLFYSMGPWAWSKNKLAVANKKSKRPILINKIPHPSAGLPSVPATPPLKTDWTSIRGLISTCGTLSPEINQTVQRHLDEIDRLKKTPRISISIVGEFNAGKSTFINELTGKNIASIANEECTKVPMRLTHSKKRSLRSRVNGSWRDLIEKDFVLQQKTYDSQVDLLEVADDFEALGALGIDLVDTPGAGSKMAERENISRLTLEIVQDSDACVILMDSAQDGSKSFFQFLNQVIQSQSRIFVLISRSDMRSDEELEEHRRLTVPKLAQALGIQLEDILFVGKKARNHVLNPSAAFSKIGAQISKQRSLILEEKKMRLQSHLREQLIPLLNRQEEVSNHRADVAQSLPTSFQDIWDDWLSSIQGIPWLEIALELKKAGESQRDLWQEQLKVELTEKLKDIWVDVEKRNKLTNAILRDHHARFKSFCVESFFKKYDVFSKELQKTAEPVFTYFARFGSQQRPLPTAGELLAASDFRRLIDEGPRDETELNLFLLAQIQDRLHQGLAVPLQEIQWDEKCYRGQGGGAQYAAWKLGGPLAALAVAAYTLYTKKQEADQDFLNEATSWYVNMSSEMNQHFASAIAEIPIYTETACDVMSEVLVSHRARLFKDDFDKNTQERKAAGEMQMIVRQGLQALELLSLNMKQGPLPLVKDKAA
jgi:GTPase Era involved in 16S rRNA processing